MDADWDEVRCILLQVEEQRRQGNAVDKERSARCVARSSWVREGAQVHDPAMVYLGDWELRLRVSLRLLLAVYRPKPLSGIE
jgi:hypothetical protein